MFRKGIRVPLKGGLGNQLFQYHAGLYVAKRCSQPLYLDLTGVQFDRAHHELVIDKLNFEGKLLYAKHRYSILSIRQHLRNLLLSRDLTNPSKRKRFRLNKLTRTYKSPRVGFDKNLERIEGPARLEGYFQSYKYYSALQLMGELSPKTLELIDPSSYFLGRLSEIKARRTLVLHVRRGDYVSVMDSFGLLSVNYYVDAMSALRQRGFSWEQVWLFTDDPTGVKSEFAQLIRDEKVELIHFDSYSNPAEEMILMSHANICVIANSTFSWWAACLSETTQAVVCPSKWFKNSEDPVDLYPSHWIKVLPSWISDWSTNF